MSLQPLAAGRVDELVRAALHEDLQAAGDITTDAIIQLDQLWQGALVARHAGCIAGLAFAEQAFRHLDAGIQFEPHTGDGSSIEAGGAIASMRGKARAILTGERVALNFLGHLSGIATLTRAFVEAVKPFKTQICCTRKTTPLLRDAEKYAVRAGGGVNQRSGLYDAVLIKDNHIAAAGSIREAVLMARREVGASVKVQLEVDRIDQLAEALDLPIDAVLLDNMDLETLKHAVGLIKGRFMTEASGGVTLGTVHAIAATGVDRISVGAVTHSAPVLDIGLDEAVSVR